MLLNNIEIIDYTEEYGVTPGIEYFSFYIDAGDMITLKQMYTSKQAFEFNYRTVFIHTISHIVSARYSTKEKFSVTLKPFR